MKKITVILFLIVVYTDAFSQVSATRKTIPLTTKQGLTPVNIAIGTETYLGHPSTKVWDSIPSDSEVKFAKLTDIQFHNGTIEVELAGKTLPTAGDAARGFVGIAFRINESNSEFECLYLRPTNGRANDQVRRNHSVQYVSFPNYPWHKSRKETPEKYESYVDLEAGVWTKVKIEVKDSTAKLFVHGASQPTLIVNDLKHGADRKGAIGLWIGPGTDAHFRNLVVTAKE